MQPKDFKQKLVLSLAPPLAVLILRGLAATWNIKEAGQNSTSPLAHPEQPYIYAVWHECALAAGFYRDQPIHALASQSFDGELISRALVGLGWGDPARGSSSRGGSAGLSEMQGFLARGDHVLLTVDGPRGPRRLAKDGAVKLARLSGRPVVPVAFACRPEPRLKSWDRMVVPPPFARGVFWFGTELRFAREVKNPAKDLQQLQTRLDQAVVDAEKFMEKDGAGSNS
jgi:lysophospholipid acyltransferase (LPLAT)-like uncharacterized protein